MPQRIDSLTQEQIDAIPGWADKWIKNGLCCDPADFKTAEEGVRGCYRLINYPEPEVVLHMGSPFAATTGGFLAVYLMQLLADKKNYGFNAPKNLPFDEFHQKGIWDKIFKQTTEQMKITFSDEEYNEMSIRFKYLVVKKIKDDKVTLIPAQHRGGNFYSSWVAYITYFRDVCGWENELLEGFKYEEMHVKSAGWCWYDDKIASIADRPEQINRNATNQMHNEKGPAIGWRDGYAVWFINGVAVDEQIVMKPETQTLEQIEKESNAEVKSLRILGFTWPRYLEEAGAECIDFRNNDVDQTAESLMKMKDGTVVLVCACPSTAKVFAMRVDRTLTTCEAAQKWLANDAENKMNIIESA